MMCESERVQAALGAKQEGKERRACLVTGARFQVEQRKGTVKIESCAKYEMEGRPAESA